MERNNLFANMTQTEKLLNSMFCAVTPRTAGFNSIEVSDMTQAGKLLTIVLMFIGGGSGSTAGGVKVTSVVALFIYIKANLTRSVGYNVFGRRIEDDALRKSSAIFCTNLTLATLSAIAICALQNLNGIDVLLEVFSAIGTVGMSAGLTTQLQTPALLILILLMYLGRVGSLSFAMSFTDKKKIAHIMQPAEKINVG